jgi:hypothetical protein
LAPPLALHEASTHLVVDRHPCDSEAMGTQRRRWSLWSAAIPVAMLFVGVGLMLDPSEVSMVLYVASLVCAGARIVRFLVAEFTPKDGWHGPHLAPDEQPRVKTTRPIPLTPRTDPSEARSAS